MGEATRRRDAHATGRPWLRKLRCPACGSRRVVEVPRGTLKDAAALGHDCDIEWCRDCKAFWEAFPRSMVEDPVCAEPCDNCAFRPGSPEQRDTEKWRALIEEVSYKPEEWIGEGGRFYCHKGVPIEFTSDTAMFAFPRKPNGRPDEGRMRVCSGWLRMIWAQRRKLKGDLAAGLRRFRDRHRDADLARWEDDGGAAP